MLKNLSIYRKQLMGIAIVMVMLCHNSLSVSDQFDSFNNAMRNFLQIGVDIFIIIWIWMLFFYEKFGKYQSILYKKI